MGETGTRTLVIKRVHEEAKDIRAFDVLPEGAADVHGLEYVPGQVAVLRAGDVGGRAYFAIASSPEDDELEFLVKLSNDPVARALYEMGPGNRVELRQVISRPDGYEWSGSTGYVQSLLDNVLPSLSDPVALVCGSREMIEQTRDRLHQMGFEPDRILTNY